MGKDRQRSASTHARLTVLYIIALSTVALLSIGAQALVQRQLTLGEGDSRVINIAGRQRMLSQRLAKAALKLHSSDSTEVESALAELALTHDLWERSHQALRRGGDLGLPGGNSPQVDALYRAIEPHYNAMATAALALQSAKSRAVITDHIQTIQANEAAFLAGMDAVVTQYVAEAEAKVSSLRKLELVLLAITLLVLLLEGVCIFRPAVRRIQQTSERLRRSRDEAQAANLAKSRFLANVSHELRTPMTAVLGATDLARSAEDSAKRNEYLTTIDTAGTVLLSLLNELISFAQIEAGRLELCEAPFSPGKLAENVAGMIKAGATDKPVEVAADVQGDDQILLVGDAQRLTQILLNLMANAYKWTDAGSVVLSTRVAAVGEDRASVRFRVTDTGVGIAASQLQRIFEPFEQGAQHRKRGGVGLGLAICRRIAEAMNGRLHLESEEGRGTTAVFEAEFKTAGAHAPDADTADAPGAAVLGKRVLVVEDNVLNQRVVQDVLQRAGHRPLLCGTGEDGVEAYQQEAFDVVITDKHLPGITGVEAARRMRSLTQDDRQVRFIALSADPADPNEAPLYDAILTKPFRASELLSAIAQGSPAEVALPGPTAAADTDEQLMAELAEAFLQGAPLTRSALQAAIDSGDLQQAEGLAHRLRGQVAYFRITPLVRRLETLERACRLNAGAEATELAPQIVLELQRLESDLRAGRVCPVAE